MVKVVIGCDFDPVLPAVLDRRPEYDIWQVPFAGLRRLLDRTNGEIPPITWLLRADASVAYAGDAYDDAYTRGRETWERLVLAGHEIGWHMHLLTHDAATGRFRFDPEPRWLEEAKSALDRHVSVRSTRTGWDYGSNYLLNRLDELGVAVDFSALPGNIAWFKTGDDTVTADWRDAPRVPYHPDRNGYQRSGPDPLNLIELPVAQFANPAAGIGKRMAWRCLQGCFSLKGLRDKTLLLTSDWNDNLPAASGDAWAFFFHPEDLTDEGTESMLRNLESLAAVPGLEFVTAAGWLDNGGSS
jgi:hypothetical protein